MSSHKSFHIPIVILYAGLASFIAQTLQLYYIINQFFTRSFTSAKKRTTSALYLPSVLRSTERRTAKKAPTTYLTAGERTPERPLGLDVDGSVFLDFLKGINYDIAEPAIPRNLELEKACRRILEAENMAPEYLKGPLGILTMICTGVNMSYYKHPFEVKVYISMYTTLLIYLDDQCERYPEVMVPELTAFVTTLGQGGDFKNPNLAHFRRLVIEDTRKYWGPIAAGAITYSTLGFLVGCLVESRFPHGLSDVPETAGRFPRYLRLKTGGSEAYAFFCFPSVVFPEQDYLETYLPTVPDLTELTNYINDILSFYKESVAGKEENTYFMNAARMHDRDPVELVKEVCKIQAAVAAEVCETLSPKPELREVAEVYIKGYTMWHLCQKRYKLAEIGITLGSS